MHLTPDQSHVYCLIGRGGFGDVYLGQFHHSESQMIVKVAIKRASPVLQLVEAERRQAIKSLDACMRREIRVLSDLRHVNIIRLLGWSHHVPGSDGPQPPQLAGQLSNMFLIYELCTGGTLADLLRSDERAAAFGWSQRLHVAKSIAAALVYMHANGTFHRDLKPQNIGLKESKQGAPPTPKILDCGLAKYIPPHDSKRSVFSQTGQVFGTPGYQCPAYFQNPKLYDAKSDMYSFGIMLGELFTGCIQNQPVTLDEDYLEECASDTRAGCWPQSGMEKAFRELLLSCINSRRRLRPENMTKVLQDIQAMLAPGPSLAEMERNQEARHKEQMEAHEVHDENLTALRAGQ